MLRNALLIRQVATGKDRVIKHWLYVVDGEKVLVNYFTDSAVDAFQKASEIQASIFQA